MTFTHNFSLYNLQKIKLFFNIIKSYQVLHYIEKFDICRSLFSFIFICLLRIHINYSSMNKSLLIE